jgi:predicted permease
MESFKQDILYGLRLLWKKPGFTAVAVLTLGLGIGANTAIFSMVSWLLLRPLPVPQGDRITELAYDQRGSGLQNNFSVPEYRLIRSQASPEFSSVCAWTPGIDGFSFGGKPERVFTFWVTGNFFSLLKLHPAAGRLLRDDEGENVNADPVVVLGYRYWRRRFNADSAVIGRKLLIDGRPFIVVGVTPKDFYGPVPIIEGEAYIPLGMNVIEGVPADFMENPAYRNVVVFGRLADGSSLQKANAKMKVVGQRLAQLYPQTDKDLDLRAFPEVRSRPQPDSDNTVLFVATLFLGLAGLVLLLACLNVGNILLVRASGRAREMAVRAALGASRLRLIRQLLTESLVLAILGGAAGILLGMWGSNALGSINLQTDLPIRLDFAFDWHVFAYAFGSALMTAVLVGIVPALRASRHDLNTVLHQGGRAAGTHGAKLRTALVVAQVAGSLMLLIIAGLFTRSLQAAQRTNLGFEPRKLVNFYMDPTEIGFHGAQVRDFYRTVLARVRALPGVESATTAGSAPLGYYWSADGLVIEGYNQPPGQPPPSSVYVATSGDYFSTLRIPLLRGRAFRDSDTESAPYVTVINQAMAAKYWPNQDPLGRHFKMNSDPKNWLTIVGIAADARFQGVTGTMKPMFFIPLEQHVSTSSFQTLEVRTTTDAASIIPSVEAAIAAIAPDLPVFDVKTMLQGMNTLNGLMFFKIGAILAALLGALGLVLSLVGVYGVISYSTAQRTQEIGIRMALGAHPGDILRMMLRQGALTVGIGTTIGIVGALAADKVTEKFLVVSGRDPLTYVAVSLVLGTVAMTACFIPARRSTKVDPMIALRYE